MKNESFNKFFIQSFDNNYDEYMANLDLIIGVEFWNGRQ